MILICNEKYNVIRVYLNDNMVEYGMVADKVVGDMRKEVVGMRFENKVVDREVAGMDRVSMYSC